MARSIRIEYAEAYYHVMARGNRREAIYKDDDDRRYFLKTLGEACTMTGWKVHAWVLMGNHYHLVIQTPEANLVAGMGWLQNTYTRRFNVRHRLWGRLFGDRYKAVLVEGSGYYYETLLDYVHLNPVRAGIIQAGQDQSILEYPWSSVAGGHALLPRSRPVWLATGEALAAFGCADTASGRRRWVARLDERARNEAEEKCGIPLADAEQDGRRSNLRRGWYWGSQEFAERILGLGERALKKTRHRSGQGGGEKRAHEEQEARRLRGEGLAAAGLLEKDLEGLPGSDRRKVAIASRIWAQTTVDLKWIAEQLKMKSAANVSQQIRRYREEEPELPKPLKSWLKLSKNAD